MKQKVNPKNFFNDDPHDRTESVPYLDENTIMDDESGNSNEDDGALWTWLLLTVHGSIYEGHSLCFATLTPTVSTPVFRRDPLPLPISLYTFDHPLNRPVNDTRPC